MNAAFYDGNPGGTVATVPPTNVGFEGRLIGAGYKFGSVTIKAAFENFRVAGGPNNNVYGGGVDYLMLPELDINAAAWYVSNRNDTGSHSLMGVLGASYFVSRRTTLYAQVGVVNNHGAQNLGLSVSDGQTSLFAPHGTTTGVNLGILHTF